MRAMAHPVRLALMEALNDAGTLTATEYGFVEEAEGGKGRQRPWRTVHTGMRFSDVQEDPEAALAAGTLARVVQERWMQRARVGLAQRQYVPEEWRKVTGSDQMTLYVTPDEMKAINDEILEVLFRYRDRIGDRAKRPEGSRQVEHVGFYYLVDR
jgi:hypothetical protein